MQRAPPATANSVRISPESQPACGPSITANAKAPTAVMNRSCPGMSNVRGRSSRARDKAPRQDQDDKSDGNVDHEDRAPADPLHHETAEGRPIAMAVLATAVQMPIAQLFNFGSGNAALTSASEVTLTVAAATPWTARARLSASSEDAIPQAAEAAVK